MSSRMLKPLSLLSGVVLGGLALLAWTMPWFHLEFTATGSGVAAVDVAGDAAAPALAALALASLALVAALAIAGPVFRIVLGILEMAIGASVCLAAWAAHTDPVAAAAPIISEHTGISGRQSVTALIDSIDPTAWPVATLVIGAALIALGGFVVVTARRWPSRPDRYQSGRDSAVRLESADEPRSAVSDWDSLSDGDDPTSR